MKNLTLTLVALLLFTLVGFSQKTATYKEVVEKSIKNGRYNCYITKENQSIKVGDSLFLGNPSKEIFYSYIVSTGEMVINALNGTPIPPLGNNIIGQLIVIKKIQVRNRIVCITTCGSGESVAVTIGNFQPAFSCGEVVVKGFISSDEALVKLQKAKLKLDLELITIEEYDEIKKELSLLIK